MKLNKEKLLKSAFGAELQEVLVAAHFYIMERKKTNEYLEPEKVRTLNRDINDLMGKWSIFQLALNHIYDIGFNFTWTDEYIGVCTDDEEEWLFKRSLI